jgi:hypothetical protein
VLQLTTLPHAPIENIRGDEKNIVNDVVMEKEQTMRKNKMKRR